MDGKSLTAHFGRIGARVRCTESAGSGLRLDITKDALGQVFDLAAPRDIDVRVVDLDPKLRHLLLLSTDPALGGEKRRYLCGHDEREWFVAAVPGRGVSRVRDAMEALKPAAVRFLQERMGVRGDARLRRRTAAYIRQGEWFFVPAPDLAPKPGFVLRNEPISRGRGKPHWVEHLYREGGQAVMVSARFPQGVTPEQYRLLLFQTPEAKSWDWRTMRRNPTAFAKGAVRHPDHATIRLDGWHQIVMNTEGEAPGVRSVVFLD